MKKSLKKVEKEAAVIVEDILVAYDGYLDAMISMYESMLTKEQLEEVEKEFQQKKLDGTL